VGAKILCEGKIFMYKHWCCQNFDFGEWEAKWKNFVIVFGDVIMILKFDFIIISLKNSIWPNHATSGHQHRKLRWSEGGEPPVFDDF